MDVLEKIARLRGSSDAFRAQDSDPVESECVESVLGASKSQKCSESNSGRPMLTSKSAQNDPGTLIIGFALKNYAQKWSQIEKWLDGCPQNDDFGIFARSLRTLLGMSMIPGLAWERLEKRSSEVSRGPSETYPPPGLAEAIAWG